MEIQERNGFSIVGFIAQVLLILLFVFVLMWLFPTKSYIENNGTAGAGTGSNSAISEMLFNQNLLSMKDAAREYFTVKRMPSTKGASKTLTLDEMIKKSMVVELVDASGKTCDREASYVKVTKVDNEYEMEVTLTCGKVTKTIKTVVGCYNYCESGMCEKEDNQVTLYQYSKKTDATSKWSNWSDWSKTSVTATKTKQVETKVETEKTGTTTKLAAATAKTSYSCPNGYELSKDQKTCTKVDTKASTAKTTYSCPKGYDLSKDKKSCTKATPKYADKVTVYSCKKGALKENQCAITETKSAIPHVTISFDCTSGACQSVSKTDYYYCADSSFKVSGKNCIKTTYVAAESKKECPAGYDDYSSTQCVKTVTSTKSSTAKTTYSCASGYDISKDQKTCTKVDTKTPTAKTAYSCSVGKLNSQNKCETTEDVYTKVTYYRFRTYTTTSAKTLYKWSTSSNDQKLIKAGYKYTGVTKVSTSK